MHKPLVCLFILASADANALTGNELLADCAGASAGTTYCLGYILGVHDGFTAGVAFQAEHQHEEKQLYCLPGRIPAGQLEKIFLKWAEDHPERLHEDSVILLLNAWREAFPCP